MHRKLWYRIVAYLVIFVYFTVPVIRLHEYYVLQMSCLSIILIILSEILYQFIEFKKRLEESNKNEKKN